MRRARYVPSGKYSKSFRASLRALARFRVFTPGSQVGKIYAAPRYIQRRGFVQEKEVFCHEDTQEYENYLKIHLLPSRLLVASHATALVARDRPCFSRRQAIRMGGPAAHPTGFFSAPLRLCMRVGPFFFVLSCVPFLSTPLGAGVNFVVSRRQ